MPKFGVSGSENNKWENECGGKPCKAMFPLAFLLVWSYGLDIVE